MSPPRLAPAVRAVEDAAGEDAFLADLLRALSTAPHSISPKYFYDEAGSRLLADWGFQPVNSALRMRHGSVVGHDPSRMFGLFNLFWG